MANLVKQISIGEDEIKNIGVDPENIDGIVPIEKGGTGNDSGYIRTGQKSDTTIGPKATAEGYNTTASGDYSHAEGEFTIASNEASHAEGSSTTASGNSSHAEGGGTIASHDSSHAEGFNTRATNDSAHSEGYATTASGYCSHAGGESTIAGYDHQTVIGKFNDNKSSNLFEIGNGNENNARSNAFEVDSAGRVTVGRSLTISDSDYETFIMKDRINTDKLIVSNIYSDVDNPSLGGTGYDGSGVTRFNVYAKGLTISNSGDINNKISINSNGDITGTAVDTTPQDNDHLITSKAVYTAIGGSTPLGSAARRSYTNRLSSTSEDLITSKAVYEVLGSDTPLGRSARQDYIDYDAISSNDPMTSLIGAEDALITSRALYTLLYPLRPLRARNGSTVIIGAQGDVKFQDLEDYSYPFSDTDAGGLIYKTKNLRGPASHYTMGFSTEENSTTFGGEITLEDETINYGNNFVIYAGSTVNIVLPRYSMYVMYIAAYSMDARATPDDNNPPVNDLGNCCSYIASYFMAGGPGSESMPMLTLQSEQINNNTDGVTKFKPTITIDSTTKNIKVTMPPKISVFKSQEEFGYAQCALVRIA